MRNSEERFGANQAIQDGNPIPQFMQDDSGEQQKVSLDFITPTEFVDLPSKGKFYRAGHPLKDKETIEIKQMTAKEEDILNSRSLLKKGVALDKLIQSLIVDKSINSDSLTVEDRNAILVTARVSAYGPEYLTEALCPSCGKKSKKSFNIIDGVKVQESALQSEPDINGYFQFTLPSTKWNVVCRTLNGGDEKTLLKIAENKRKSESQNDSLLLEQLKLCIVSIQGVTAREMIQKAVDSMPARDSKFLRDSYQEAVPGIKIIQPFSCGSCDYEADMEVPLSTDFFWFK